VTTQKPKQQLEKAKCTDTKPNLVKLKPGLRAFYAIRLENGSDLVYYDRSLYRVNSDKKSDIHIL